MLVYLNGNISKWSKSVKMECDFLFRLSCLFGVSEDAFIRATDDVMLSLLDNIQVFIRWPNKEDYPRIADNFQAVGR